MIPKLLRAALRRDVTILRRSVQQRTFATFGQFHAPTRNYAAIKANGLV